MKALTEQEVKTHLKELLYTVTEICEKKKLRYFLAYGTLLGAVRHKDMIPWDDDIDIMMPRPDYEKLRKYFLAHEQEKSPYRWFDQERIPEYPHMIARISDMRYHLKFQNEIDYGIGLFIDIYPLDGLGDEKKPAQKTVNRSKRLASLCYLASRKKFLIDRTEGIKVLFKFPAYCWAKMLGSRHYVEKLRKFTGDYDYDSSCFVGCVVWPEGNRRDLFCREWFSETVRLPFGAHFFRAPADYDAALKLTYGDYMTPPDEKGKALHHNYSVYRR